MLEDRKLPADQRAHLEKLGRTVDAMSAAEIAQNMKALNVVAPETKNPLSDPYPYNLMFATQIGPRGDNPAYLRPETAQGIFINFKRLLDFNNGRLPFGVAQIGRAFRNEIAPRSGLLRVREFEMAEIEYFVNVRDKSHPKFASVAQLALPLFDREHQLGDGKVIVTPLGEAVAAGTIANETLAYFLARTYLFLVKIGLKADRIRFRQHLATEMAHYACDCWDAECHSSYGWVECVGHADRACFDLSHHSEFSGVELNAYEKFDKPQQQEIVELVLDKKALGSHYKKDAKLVTDALEALAKNNEAALAWTAAAAAAGSAQVVLADGRSVEVQAAFARFEKKTKEIAGANFYPGVIEPSFGIGRVIYSLLEHCYWVREGDDEKRAVLSLPPLIAPYKCSVLPLMSQERFAPFTLRLRDLLRRSGLSCRVDDSSVSIGRRYARMDEVGVPFAVTIDFTTFEDDTVTLRERDSTCQVHFFEVCSVICCLIDAPQVRIPIAELSRVLQRLCEGAMTWAEVSTTFPIVAVAAE
jgi:glycyl-tRNA synthetase